MKELSLRQAQLPGKNVFYYSKYEEFSIEIMGGTTGEKRQIADFARYQNLQFDFSPDVR